MSSNTDIGARIHQRRKELRLTLLDVANMVGVQKSTISRYERGSIKRVKMAIIESIARALNVDFEWLIGGETDAPGDFLIRITWDPESLMWVAESNDIPGLILRSGSFDALLERVRFAVPRLLRVDSEAETTLHLNFVCERHDEITCEKQVISM